MHRYHSLINILYWIWFITFSFIGDMSSTSDFNAGYPASWHIIYFYSLVAYLAINLCQETVFNKYTEINLALTSVFKGILKYNYRSITNKIQNHSVLTSFFLIGRFHQTKYLLGTGVYPVPFYASFFMLPSIVLILDG